MPNHALDAYRSPRLLERLLETPNLPQVVRELDPQILHRLVRVVGLEDCGEIVSLATPAQLTRVFDADLWRSDRPGEAERFDADRFGVWLEVLVESGVANAAQKVAGLEIDFVTAAILEHVVVVDQTAEIAAAVFRQAVNDSREEEVYERPSIIERLRESGATCEMAGYAIVAKRHESWDALVAVLGALHDDHQDFFNRLMNGCCSVSAKQIEDDSGSYHLSTAPDQLRFDVTVDRERRREGQGYVTASEAAAFLHSARRLPLRAHAAPPRDHATRGYFRTIDREPSRWNERDPSSASPTATSSNRQEPGLASFLETLREAGVVTEAPRGLLIGGTADQSSRLSRINEQMRVVAERDEDVYATRSEELGYLANALVAGCSFNSSRFSPSDAQDAVVATCNLGLENWPPQWLPPRGADVGACPTDSDSTLPPDFLLHQDLATVFQVGWTVLYEHVIAYVARRLMEILSELSSHDSDLHDDLRVACRRLHASASAGTPWRARDQLDVVAILDTPSWALLLRLIDECPAMPTELEPSSARGRSLRVSTHVRFISENRQIGWVREFLEQLPERLAG